MMFGLVTERRISLNTLNITDHFINQSQNPNHS